MALNIAQMLGQQTPESGTYTKSSIDQQRKLAEVLRKDVIKDAGWGGALANTLRGAQAGSLSSTADMQDAAGTKLAQERLALALQDPDAGIDVLGIAASDPFLPDNASQLASALLGQKIEQQDPAYQLDLAYKQAQLDAMGQPAGADPTSAIQNYEYLVSQGTDPAQAQGMAFGAPTTNNIGTIPAGYQVDYDELGRPASMSPIPNSPAALAAEQEQLKRDLQSSGKDVVTDTIVSEAQKAREAAKGFAATGVGNFLTGGAGFMPAAQVNQHVEALKSIASSENINAMRQASPTGGALGNTSDADLRLLQNKAGALNPQSPTFDRDLADYERTLLRIVHGPEAGDIIFQSTRPEGSAPADSGYVDDILKGYGL